MSRIGRIPIVVPPGVEVHIRADNYVEVKGPKGLLCRQLHPRVLVHRNGVTTGFEKQLEIVWSGFRAQVQQKTLTLQLGHSHPITYEAPEGLEFELNRTLITVRGIDKELVGQVAANIRSVRKPEPYKGKGIKYTTETIRRKEGKS